jgi:hypothetical protein
MAMNNRVFLVALALLLAAVLLASLGCDAIEDKAKEEATKDVDKSFDDQQSLELAPIEITESSNDVMPQAQSCVTTSVQAELDKTGADLSQVDLDSVTLLSAEVRYRNASWTPEDIPQLSCTATCGGPDAGVATVTETAVIGSSGDWTQIVVSEEASMLIDFYLNHRDAQFTCCASCVDEPETFYVEYDIKLNVRLQGEIII